MDSQKPLFNSSDAFLCSGDSSYGDKFFDGLAAIDAVLDGGRRNDTEYNRVRIAIIDTGIDMTHPEVQNLRKEAWPRVTYCDFTGKNLEQSEEQLHDSTEIGVDLVGHGTHIAVTVMRIAKWAEIFVARVVDLDGIVNPQSLGKALERAIQVWKVNIITMSFGFAEVRRECFHQLKAALNNDILVFAAASNQGASAAISRQAWPARDTQVFGAYSADFLGNRSKFNPPDCAGDGFSHFKFLGEDVESAWPLHLLETKAESTTTKHGASKKLGFRRMTGTSVAAPIGAATAALFIEFVQQNKDGDHELETLIKSPSGMKDVFAQVGVLLEPTHTLRYVLPWSLIKAKGNLFKVDGAPDQERIAHITRRALADVDSALDIQRLSGEEQKQQKLQSLATEFHGVKRQAEEHEENFKAKKTELHDRTETTLNQAALGSAGVIGAAAVGAWFLGPLVLVLGSVGLTALYKRIWDLLTSERNDVEIVLNTAVKEETVLLQELEDISRAISEDSTVEVPARILIKRASKTISRAEVLRQTNLIALRASVGVDVKESAHLSPSTYQTGVEVPSYECDISTFMSDPDIVFANLDVALKRAAEDVNASNASLMAESHFLSLWIERFNRESATRPELPHVACDSDYISYIIRSDVEAVDWYKYWECTDMSMVNAARVRFLAQLLLTSQALEREARNHYKLQKLLVDTQQNIQLFDILKKQELPELKLKLEDFEYLRDENQRTQRESKKSWVTWFLRWLELAHLLFNPFG